jgi:4-aminobutyrate aminotransferase
MRARLDIAAARHPWIGEVRGRGLMLAIETVQPGGIVPNAPAATAVLEAARRHGVLIGKGGLYGNVLRIAPPLSITEAEADRGIDAIEAALTEVSAAG